MLTQLQTLKIPTNPAARRAWLVFKLRELGLSVRRLAAQEGVSSSAILQAMNLPSSYMEALIARTLGVQPRDLFPERFDSSGRRIIPTREPHRNRAVTAEERSKRARS